MKITYLILVVLMTLTIGCSQKPKEDILGIWTAVTAIYDGSPLPDDMVKSLRLTLTENVFRTQDRDEILFDSSYTLDATQNPPHINMLGNEGDLAGKYALGIYSLKGDELKLCYTMPGGERPAAFESFFGSQIFYIVWKRQ